MGSRARATFSDWVEARATMKSFTDYLTLNIPSKMAFVNITPQVEDAIKKSGVKEGIALINRKRRIVQAVQT